MTAPTAPGYSTPKQGILLYVKRRPGASLTEIAEGLGLSKAAAHGHLTRLESDGLLARRYLTGKVGRPQVAFELTDSGRSLFPQAYSEMSLSALRYVERRLGRPAVSELLTERAHEVADRQRSRLRDGTLPRKVEELARIRTEGGYMAELGPRSRGSVELLEHNCPVLAIAGEFPEACEIERRMFESLLGASVQTSHRVVAGDPVCRFRIRSRGGRP